MPIKSSSPENPGAYLVAAPPRGTLGLARMEHAPGQRAQLAFYCMSGALLGERGLWAYMLDHYHRSRDADGLHARAGSRDRGHEEDAQAGHPRAAGRRIRIRMAAAWGQARDLEYFVKYLGMSPMDTLLSATQLGGQIMMRPQELGQIREGYLADLLLVDGDPLVDITVLQKPERLLAVMKDGRFHKMPPAVEGRAVTRSH